MTSPFSAVSPTQPISTGVARNVVGALHSAGAVAVVTSMLGRRALHVAGATDLISSVEHEGARALMVELGHPAFDELCTRLSVVGSDLPIVLVLPPGAVSARDVLLFTQTANYSLAYDHRELPAVLRRTMTRGVAASDAHEIGKALGTRLPSEAAALGLGLYVVGTHNVSVARAAARLGFGGALRNRLRTLGLARASTILGWACAVGVVWRMENEQCSLAEAARIAGFDTTRQCSERALYHTGRTPTALRDRYGFRALVGEFVDAVTMRVSSVH